MAAGPGPGHAGWRHGADRAGERDLRRVRADGGGGVRDDACVCGIHHRGAGRRRVGDAHRVCGRPQEPAGPDRGYRAGQRGPDRAVCRAAAGARQLLCGADADGPAVLAGRGSDDVHRHPHRGIGDRERTLGLVRRGAGADGLPDLCDDALPAAAPSAMRTPLIGTTRPLATSAKRALEPGERIAEVLFGLIMVLSFTGSLSVADAGRDDVRTMLIGALGCNIAWGIIDGILYLMDCLSERARDLRALRAARNAAAPEDAHRVIAEALPPVVAATLGPAEYETVRQKLLLLPEPASRPWLSKADWLGGLAVFLWVFVTTFPVAIPFIFMSDVARAMRVSNVIAVGLLVITGYAFGRITNYHPWLTGLAMVLLGGALVAATIALGG